MLDIKSLQNSWLFKNITLPKDELLFDEWSLDHNLYILVEWKLCVEKYTTKEKDIVKKLAILKPYDVIWEASLSNDLPKEVRIRASQNSTLLSIEAKKWIHDFLIKHTKEWIELFKHIIDQSNERLLKSNSQIASTYQMNKAISSLNKIDNKSIFSLMDEFKSIIKADSIKYIEKNPVLDDYYTLKYDTNKSR